MKLKRLGTLLLTAIIAATTLAGCGAMPSTGNGNETGENASVIAATEEDTASEVEEAAVEEAEPPQAVMPTARARATTATATFLSFISIISLFLKKYLHRGPCVRGLSARQYSSLFYKKIKRFLDKDCNISGESTLL